MTHTSEADSLLVKRISNYLFQRSRPSLRSVKVEADNGSVTIRGRVESFYEKQLCICSCQRVVGVVRLIDRLEVVG